MSSFVRYAALAISVALAACSTSDDTKATIADAGPVSVTPPTFGGARPLDQFRVPANYDPAKPAPLVVVLHGYGVSGFFQNLFFRLPDIADQEGFFIAAPDGTLNAAGRRFWNATPECCDFEGSGVDDLGYITGLITEIRAAYAIDPKRIYVVGHSNGGAMAFRLACDASEVIAGVVSLAGPFFADAAKCAPKVPVSVQHMHGTADETVPFEGGKTASVHPNATSAIPSAPSIATTWAGLDKCAPTAIQDPPLDNDGNIAGAETKVTRFAGCGGGSEVVLWTLEGTSHVPGNLVPDFPNRIYAFLKAHPKP